MIKMKQLVSQFANMTSKTPIQGDLESLVSPLESTYKKCLREE